MTPAFLSCCGGEEAESVITIVPPDNEKEADWTLSNNLSDPPPQQGPTESLVIILPLALALGFVFTVFLIINFQRNTKPKLNPKAQGIKADDSLIKDFSICERAMVDGSPLKATSWREMQVASCSY